MNRTRAELDEKLVALQARVGELSPQNLKRRYMPDYLLDRVIGGILTLVGTKMMWSHMRSRRNHRGRLRSELATYGSW
jgi:hypothetical protein